MINCVITDHKNHILANNLYNNGQHKNLYNFLAELEIATKQTLVEGYIILGIEKYINSLYSDRLEYRFPIYCNRQDVNLLHYIFP